MAASGNWLALDVGGKRIGLAVASPLARLPSPLGVLPNDDSVWEQLAKLITDESVGTVIVGLPRGLDGQETDQTAYCRQFAAEVAEHLGIAVVFQDEALTSKKAEDMLKQRNKPYAAGDIDALAASFILDDYLQGMTRTSDGTV